VRLPAALRSQEKCQAHEQAQDEKCPQCGLPSTRDFNTGQLVHRSGSMKTRQPTYFATQFQFCEEQLAKLSEMPPPEFGDGALHAADRLIGEPRGVSPGVRAPYPRQRRFDGRAHHRDSGPRRCNRESLVSFRTERSAVRNLVDRSSESVDPSLRYAPLRMTVWAATTAFSSAWVKAA
jgi:hypothetical protein